MRLQGEFPRLSRYAKASSLAYEKPSEIEAAFPNARLSNPPSRRPGDKACDTFLRYFVWEDPESPVLLIAIQGTESPIDVTCDASYAKNRSNELEVDLHAGFYTVGKAIADKLARENEASLKTRRIELTGQSLGGAAAVITGALLSRRGYGLDGSVRVVTFGQPKVTDRTGSFKLGSLDLIRVVDPNDPVVYSPPATYLADKDGAYRHFGKTLVLYDGREWAYVPAKHARTRDLNSLWKKTTEIDPKDHKILGYVKLLGRIDPAKRVDFNDD
jgi:hypothetical protein